MKVYCFW